MLADVELGRSLAAWPNFFTIAESQNPSINEYYVYQKSQ